MRRGIKLIFDNTKKVMEAIINNKPIATKNTKVNEVFKKIGQLEDLKEDAREMLLKTISLSASLGNIEVNIKHLMDEIEAVMNKLSSQSENTLAFVEETTASMGEIDTAIEDNVKNIDEIHDNIESIVKNNNKNVESIRLMSDVCGKVTESNNAVNTTLTKLLDNLKEIGNIVEVIEQIADQTNLLALNASIEAARAGEAGRGFAVVSEEIRKLADSTKESLDKFKSFTQEIHKDSAQSLESMKRTNEVMGQIPSVTSTIKEAVEENFNAINKIKSDMESFVASFQQISTAASEITSTMNSVSSETEDIVDIVSRLDKDLEKLESIKEQINNMDAGFMAQNKGYYQKFFDNNNPVTKEELAEILENARRQHSLWMDTLEEAVNDAKLIPLQVDSNRCAFGHFYNSIIIKDNDIKELWESIDKYHKNLHDAGEKALVAVKNREFEEAKKQCQIAKENSKNVFDIIDKIIKILIPGD